MKFIYVLISSNSDLYFEQMLLSIISLKKYNPNGQVIVLVDKDTASSFIENRKIIYDYAEIIVVSVPTEMNKKARSRFLKTSINKYVKGSFLFIDCDTIICSSLSDLEGYSDGVYCVLDKHLELHEHRNAKDIKKNTKKLKFKAAFNYDKHFNSGVILFKDCEKSQELFNQWHELWLFSASRELLIDQPAFNEANYKLGKYIIEMPGEWNCQISDNGLPYLAESKIIHYFASNLGRYKSPYIFADKSIYKTIKDGNITIENLDSMLSQPRSAFCSQTKIISDEAELRMFSSFFGRCLARFFKFIINN